MSPRFSLSALSPFGPIFGKEMRVTSRRKRSYFLRVIYLGFLLLFLILVWTATGGYSSGGGAVWRQQQQAELGQAFFITFSMFCVGAMGLIGPVLTATAVNSERLHRTLGVLLMTPINSWQIVAGKLFSRMLIALTLIGLSLPVLALVRLLGGVEAGQMFGVICLSAVTALTGAAIGLLLSTVIRRGYAVILLAYGAMMFLYLFVPMIVALTLLNNSGASERFWASVLSIGNPFASAAFLSSSFTLRMANWEWCVVAHVAFSGVLTVLSAVLLRRMARRENEGGPVVAPLPGVPEMQVPAPPPLPLAASPDEAERRIETATLPVGRSAQSSVSDNPVLWRELRRPLMARRWQRIVGSIACVGLLLITYAVLASESDLADDDTQIGYGFIFNVLTLLTVCVLSATAIAQEKEGDTWTLLLTTPMSGRAIIMAKFWGTLRKMLWPMILIAAHFLIFTISGVISWVVLAVVLWVIATFNVLWIATGIFLSLRISKVTFAVVLNLMLPIFVYAVVPIVLLILGEIVFEYRNELPELSLYYMPYYYIGYAIDEITPRLSSWSLNRHIMWLPHSDSDVSVYEWLRVCFYAGAGYLLATALVLWRTIAHFDRIVGRASQTPNAVVQAR